MAVDLRVEDEKPAEVELKLGRSGMHCRLIVNGQDISNLVQGVTIFAHVNGLTRVKLEMSCRVRVSGEAGVLEAYLAEQPEKDALIKAATAVLAADKVTA